jgi:endonuclease I
MKEMIHIKQTVDTRIDSAQRNFSGVLRFLPRLLLLVMLLLSWSSGWGQYNINAGSTNYTQDFNTLTSGTWTDNSSLTGWYARTDLTASVASYAANTGSTTTAGLYAFGVAGTNPLSDRALGWGISNAYTGSAGTGKAYVGWRLKNNTGSTITSITVTWAGEQWRKENIGAQSLTLEYQTGTTVTALTGGTWTTASSSFSSLQNNATAVAIDGNTAANRTANISVTITVSIPAGNEIMLRWADLNDSGVDHLMAIDDITVNAATSAATPTLSVTPTSLSGFNYVLGAGPSAAQSFDLSGTNLTGAPGNITVSGSTNYEVSLSSGSGYASSVNVAYSTATLSATTIYVRLKAGLSATTYNENISYSGGGVSSTNFACNGSVSAGATPTITVSPSSLNFEKVYTGFNSLSQPIAVTGADLTADITVTPPTGIELSATCTGTYSSSLTLTRSGSSVNTTIYARYTGGAVSSNIAFASTGATTKNVAISETANSTNLPGSYYSAASGTGATLKTNLYNIIKGHTAVTYTPGVWNAYATTDLRPDGKIWDMYTGSSCVTPTVNFIYVTNSCGTYTVEGDCYNREHSWPNSWFGGVDGTEVGGVPGMAADAEGSIAYTDLHHVIPTDGFVNYERSAWLFGEVSTPSSTYSNGSMLGSGSFTGGYSGTVFELRDEFKGDIARMYLYMITRYEVDLVSWENRAGSGNWIMNGTTFPGLEQWYIDYLVACHNADPVDQKEMTRNDAVYAIQGNRNPFIDHPEYVAAVWGASLSTSVSTLTGFNYTEGAGPSANQTFTLNGNALVGSGNIVVSCATNYEISLSSGSGFASSINVPFASGVVTGQPKTIYVRLKSGLTAGNYNSETISIAGGSATTIYVTCSGTVSSGSPTLTGSTTTFTGFTYVEGAGPSTTQTYNLSGTNLSGAPGNITVSCATNYEVSLSSGSGFASSINVAYASATLSSTPIYIRLKAGLSAGNYNSETVANAGGGATTVNVTCSGTVTAASSNCANETFANIPTTSSSSYLARTWTGDDGGTWDVSADARTDQTLNGKAITIRNSVLTSPSKSGGIGNLSFQTKFPFTETSGSLTIAVNGNTVGTVAYADMSGTTPITKTINGINVGGDIVVTITSATARFAIDDLTWTCYTPSGPEINIQESASSYANASTFAFGSVSMGSSSATKTFTVQNIGTSSLALSGTPKVAISGTNAADFTIDQSSTSASVAASGTTTFTIIFTPSSIGSKTAAISIANDDVSGGENPYVINLSGTGTCVSQTITFGALTAKTYGDATFTLGATASSGLSVSYASSNTAVATVSGNTVTIVGAGTTTITASQAGNGTYCAATNVPQTLTVNAKALTISGASASNKVYDATNTAAVSGGSLVGIVGADVVTLTQSGTFASANVGVGIAVTSTSTLGGAQAANYTLTQPSGLSANITAKALTVTSDNISKIFGATLTSGAGKTTFTSSGLVGGQTIGSVTLTFGTGAAAGDAIGTYTGTSVPTAATGGTFTASNYSISYVNGNIIVTAAPTISTSGTLSAVNTTYGTASATPTSFNVSGTAMSAGILVTPPAGYEVCLTIGGTYTSTVTVGAAGTIASTTVYVRLAAATAVGTLFRKYCLLKLLAQHRLMWPQFPAR